MAYKIAHLALNSNHSLIHSYTFLYVYGRNVLSHVE